MASQGIYNMIPLVKNSKRHLLDGLGLGLASRGRHCPSRQATGVLSTSQAAPQQPRFYWRILRISQIGRDVNREVLQFSYQITSTLIPALRNLQASAASSSSGPP